MVGSDGGVIGDEIIAAVRATLDEVERNADAVFWLSWGCALHSTFTREAGASVASIAEHGIDTKRHSSSAVGAGGVKQFVTALEVTIQEVTSMDLSY